MGSSSKHSQAEIDAIIKADPTKIAVVPVPGKVHDVWPGYITTVDPSRVDRVQAALRTKLETMGGFDEAPRLVKKLFADCDVDGDGSIVENEFIKLMVTKMNFSGYDSDVKALFARFDVDRSGKLEVGEFCSMLFNEPGSRATTSIGKVREVLTKRAGGVTSLKSLGLQFRLLDSEKSGGLSRAEMEEGFAKFMRGYGITLTRNEIDELFKMFDKDHSGSISYDEFLVGIRGGMNDFRKDLVRQAYDVISDGASIVTMEMLAKKYDVSGNPLVKSGKITAADCLRAFIAHWHLGETTHTDSVDLADFLEYYEWVAASIDRDDYFELMIRNAWHISGGEGWAQNTANLRVLVTHEDGHQSVEEIKNDLGLDRNDFQEIKRRLYSQGIRARMVSVKDSS